MIHEDFSEQLLDESQREVMKQMKLICDGPRIGYVAFLYHGTQMSIVTNSSFEGDDLIHLIHCLADNMKGKLTKDSWDVKEE